MRVLVTIVLVAGCLLPNAQAGTPAVLNYQGRVVDGDTLLSTNGMSLWIRLHDAPTAGNLIYRELDTVDVVDGLYSTTIGDNQNGGTASSLVAALNTLGTNAWLGIQIGTDPELMPRQRLLASPFAMNVRGIVVDESGRVGIGDAVLGQELEVAGDARIGGRSEGATDGDSEYIGIEGQSFTWVLGVQNESTSGASDFFIGHGQTEDGYFHIQTDGKVGIGTTDPVEKLQVDGAVVVANSQASVPEAGTIRWTGTDFEGFDGTVWWSLTKATAKAPDGMAYIPGGPFQMGDHSGEGEADELPVHTVSVSAFYMDRFEVTNEEMRDMLQWAYDQEPPLVGLDGGATTVTNTVGSGQELYDLDDGEAEIAFSGGTFSVPSGKTNFPAGEMGWYGAQAYCNFRSDREGLQRCVDFADWSCDFSKNGYRLPTEAEWEKAARGGLSGHHYPWPSSAGSWSNHINGGMANYDGSMDPYEGLMEADTTPIGYYDGNQSPGGADMANGYGLYDMAGNVWEHCYDWSLSDWYTQAGATLQDTTGPTGPLTHRVKRGGGITSEAYPTRCANRGGSPQDVSNARNGFRCVRRP